MSQQLPTDISLIRAASFSESVHYALQGIGYLVKSQRNFKIELIIAALVMVAGFFFQIQPVEWLVICLIIGLVFVTEALNTAVEAVVDLHASEMFHPLAKIAKDTSAGACLMAAGIAVVIGVIIFLPYLQKSMG